MARKKQEKDLSSKLIKDIAEEKPIKSTELRLQELEKKLNLLMDHIGFRA